MANDLFEHSKKIPKLSPDAVEAFRRALPKLIIFTNEKLSLEFRFAGQGSNRHRIDLLEHCNTRFGHLLLGVFEFSLYENLAKEFIEYSITLESRGFKLTVVESMVKAWLMGIQCTVAHPADEELLPPLEWLLRNLPQLYKHTETVIPEPDKNTQKFLDFILQKNRKFATESLLALIRGGSSIEEVFASVLLPALEHIRLLWRQNSISVADEHVATDICRYVMFRVIDSIFGERKYPYKALVTCMPSETDLLGGELFANYIEIKGWSVYFIGQTATADEIIHAVQKNRPQVVVLSVASIACLPEAGRLINNIRASITDVKIVAEGRACLLARERLEPLVDATVISLEDGHAKMLNMVMPHA